VERKILVIDDEQPTLNMFRLLLAAYGYDPHRPTGRGLEGLRAQSVPAWS
jgi:hypothetical protein